MEGELGASKKWTDTSGGPIIEVDPTSGFTVVASTCALATSPPILLFSVENRQGRSRRLRDNVAECLDLDFSSDVW